MRDVFFGVAFVACCLIRNINVVLRVLAAFMQFLHFTCFSFLFNLWIFCFSYSFDILRNNVLNNISSRRSPWFIDGNPVASQVDQFYKNTGSKRDI